MRINKAAAISSQQDNNFIKPSYGGEYSEDERSNEGNSQMIDEHQKSEDDIPQEGDYESEFDKYEMKFPSKYHNNDDSNRIITQESTSSDGKIVRWYENQKKEVIFK